MPYVASSEKKAISGVQIEIAKSGPRSVFRIEIGRKHPDKNWGLSDKGFKGIFMGRKELQPSRRNTTILDVRTKRRNRQLFKKKLFYVRF